MHQEQILAQMGVVQWHLRQPTTRPIADEAKGMNEAAAEVAAEPIQPEPIQSKPIQPEPAALEAQAIATAAPLAMPTATAITAAALAFSLKTLDTVAHATAAAAGKNWLFLFDNRAVANPAEEQLFNNILKAVGFTPLASKPHDDRAIWLQELPTKQVNLLLLMGESVAAMVLADESLLADKSMPRCQLLPQQTLPTPARILLLPNLSQLIEQPQQKRAVWSALQAALDY